MTANVPESTIRAVRAAQAVMREHKPGLIVDGHWGNFTQRAYDELAKTAQIAVDSVLGSFNTSVTRIKSEYDAARLSATRVLGDSWIDQGKARAILERAANLVGIPFSALKDFLDLEPAKKATPNGVFYDTKSTNGQYRGLFQFGPAAWDSARSYLKRVGINVDLGSFSANVYDPWLNSVAAAAFAKFNEEVVVAKLGPKVKPFSGADYYTMHNQGAGGFIRLREGGALEGKQSANAVKYMQTAQRA